MIEVNSLTKEFKMYTQKQGFLGSMTTLFSREYELVRAVDQISFRIQPGQKVGYMGANGAGKSTTIKMLTGIMTPTSGECIVHNIVPYKERQKNAKNIGVVFGQRTQLWWDLPVNDSFTILKRIYEIPDPVYDKNMKLFKELLNIDKLSAIPVRKLSLGERMRAEIVAALLHDPKVVFLDEPTIGLDVILKESIRAIFNKINKEVGTTIVLTSHDTDDIKEICERVIIVDKGKKIFDDKMENLCNLELEQTLIIDLGGIPDDFTIVAEKVATLDDSIRIEKIRLNRMKIFYNRNRIEKKSIVSYLFSHFEINDFYSLETDLKDIIKKIYVTGN
jgi:ABC-2 type transport system ATP-binding protein